MAGQLPGHPSYNESARMSTGTCIREELPQPFVRKWFFTKEEIEYHSPSRKDGVTFEEESHLRKLYCSYLQELGMEFKVPQLTIATATVLCHRFYMHQSHAKNHWQTIATSSMFLACKAEETPRWLSDFVVVAYKLMYKWDPLAPQRIRQRELYDKQKEIILIGERLLLATVAFDLNIEHPYKPLVAAVKKLDIPHKEVVKVAWNFVNDWLRTTLCLEYKPHYIAAGSLFLSAKLQKVKLPTKGNAWWMQFDVSPKQLEEVIMRMQKLLAENQKQVAQPIGCRNTVSKSTDKKTDLSSPESCITSGSAQDSRNVTILDAGRDSRCAVSTCTQRKPDCNYQENVKEREHCQISDSGSTNSAVGDGDLEPKVADSDPNPGCKIVSFEASYNKIDVNGIRERIKKRKLDRHREMKLSGAMDNYIDGEAWIEKELENGIEKT